MVWTRVRTIFVYGVIEEIVDEYSKGTKKEADP